MHAENSQRGSWEQSCKGAKQTELGREKRSGREFAAESSAGLVEMSGVEMAFQTMS